MEMASNGPSGPIESHPIGAGKSKDPSQTASNGIDLMFLGLE